MHFQYAISINILCAKLPQVRNKELVKVLIVPEGIHVTERKTKGSPVQEDVRERPNQAWIQNSPRGCLWRPASGVSTGICQWLSLNPATNLAAHCQWYTPLGIVNLPFLLCEWPQLLTYYWSPKHERREIKRITRSSTFKTHLCNCKTSWWQKCCLELFFSLTTVSTARCIMWQCNEGPGETSSWVHGNWLLNPARSVHSLSVATRWDKKYNLPYLQRALQGWARRLHKQRCAGRAAGVDSSHCFPSPPLTSTKNQHCGFAWVPSGSPVLGQVYCFWAFNMPQVFTARIPTAFCARAFYGKLQRSPLSPTQTFRLLWI